MFRFSLTTVVAYGLLANVLACGQLDLKQAEDNFKQTDSTTLSSDAEAALADLGLNSEGRPDTREEFIRGEGIVETLSDAAKAMFVKVRDVLDGFRAEKEKICSHDSTTKVAIATAIQNIRNASELTLDQKRAQIEALFASNADALAADRQAFKSCVASRSAELKVWDDKETAVAQACGLPSRPKGHPEDRDDDRGQDRGQGRGHGRGHGHGGEHGPEAPHTEGSDDNSKQDPALNRELMALELEAGLTSDACAAAIVIPTNN